MKEIKKEGVAVNIENQLSLFKEEINEESMMSGRLFDQDIDKRDLVFLDMGCGIGKHILILRNNGIRHIIGFDIVQLFVSIAAKDYGLQNLFVGNALNVPLSDNSVDRCLLYNIIEHVSSPEKVLKETYRVLKDDGILYVDIPNSRSIGDRIFRWGGKLLYGRTSHIQKFTKKSMGDLIEKSGYVIVETKINYGIFVDYPQLKKFKFIKTLFKFFFNNEVNNWELKLAKKI